MTAPVLSIATAITLGLTATIAAAETVTWRFNNNYAPTRPESAHIRNFADNVAANSSGSFMINVIEGGGMNLMDADALRWMQTGTPEIAFICIILVAGVGFEPTTFRL